MRPQSEQEVIEYRNLAWRMIMFTALLLFLVGFLFGYVVGKNW